MPIDPLFRTDDEFLPLQAADLFAWLLRNGFDNPENRPFPWIVKELSNVAETEYSQSCDKERMEAVMHESLRIQGEGPEKYQDLISTFRRIRSEGRLR